MEFEMVGGAKHGRGSDQVSLRLPDGMRDRIKAAAEISGRSMNAEIIATLEDVYGRPGEIVTRETLPSMTFKIEDLIGRIDQISADVRSLKNREKD